MSDSDNNMRREFDSLKENVEAKMKTMEANNKAAHAESESAIERLRSDMAQLRSGIFIQMVGVIAGCRCCHSRRVYCGFAIFHISTRTNPSLLSMG